MLERHIARSGAAPRQLAADRGFATRDKLSQAKDRGVHDMAFHKRGGLRIEDMVRSRWAYRQFRNGFTNSTR
jgi:IS5 family transposase